MPVEFEEDGPSGAQPPFQEDGKGMVGFLVRSGIIKDEREANQILVIGSVLALIVAGFFFWQVISMETRGEQAINPPPPPPGVSTSSLFVHNLPQ